MHKFFILVSFIVLALSGVAQQDSTIRKKDRKRDVLIQTSMGDIVVRLSDSTPIHRDNFLKLAKVGFYDSILFHRVMKDFMIQAGDPVSKRASPGVPLGNGGPGYTIPAEFRTTLFHKKGVIAAARQPDYVNPNKESNGSQFYLVQGKKFTDEELNAMESGRLNGRKLAANQREAYKNMGGTPHLDENYTIFGEVINGLEVIDKIAIIKTSKGNDIHRPLEDVRIISMKLIKRKKIKSKRDKSGPLTFPK